MKLILTLALGAAALSPAAFADRDHPTPGALKVSVSPQIVEPGQPVTVTLSNFDDWRYMLPNGCLFSKVVSGDDGTGRAVRNYLCTAVMPILNPRDSFSKTWDGLDDDGNPVPVGVYSFPIDVLTGDGRVVELVGNVIVGMMVEEAPRCRVDYYGACGPGAGGISPELFPLGEARIGNEDFILHIQAGLGAAPGFLLVGAEQGQARCSIGTLAIEPSAPWIAIPLVLRGEPGVIGAGVLDILAPIPDDPSLGGLTVYLQALAEDRASVGGISHSAGLALTLGE
jgi:hypothetical protein